MATATAGRQDLGLIGSRQLLAVQLISIGRLTPHVIPFVAGTFVAISGRGPKGDSNESSKTTALAATSLLLGDSEWKLRGAGGQYATGLLYNPPGLEHLAHAAEHGYVIGLFSQPGEPPTDLQTVWLRINRRAPYIDVKVQDGDGLLGFDDGELVPALADEHWRAMTHVGAGSSLGARFAETLYGTSPRCIAHLTKRGNMKTRNASLLNAAAGGFGPEEIGDELVRLAGRHYILEDDRSQRARLDEVTDLLAERQREAIEREREYERQIKELDNRDRARRLLEAAQFEWTSHDARRLIDGLEVRVARQGEYETEVGRRAGLDEQLATAERAISVLGDDTELRARHGEAKNTLGLAETAQETAKDALRAARAEADSCREQVLKLRAEADGWTGDLAMAEAAAQAADAALADRGRELAVAEADLQRAEGALRQAEVGRGDAAATLDRLDAAGVGAVGLLDSVELDFVGRRELEPLLWPYRDAVVVEPANADAALTALAGAPWAVMISGPSEAELPVGVTRCPSGARQFLSTLAFRGHAHDNPARVSDSELTLTVLAGQDALTGRDARVRAAQSRVAQASASLAEAAGRHERAELVAGEAADELQRAEAAAALPGADEALAQAERQINEATQVLSRADETLTNAKKAERDLDVLLLGLVAERERAEERVSGVAATIGEDETLVAGLRAELQALGDSIAAAEAAWGGTEQAAARTLRPGRS